MQSFKECKMFEEFPIQTFWWYILSGKADLSIMVGIRGTFTHLKC